jgi:hypothetical protein
MHGRRTALRYSPSAPSPAGAGPRGQSTVLPFGSGVARSILRHGECLAGVGATCRRVQHTEIV